MGRRAAWAVLVAIVVALGTVPARPASGQERPDGVPEATDEATVVGHVDGDKITVEVGGEEEEVVLLGVDAPEPGECFADESAAYVEKLVPADTAVYLERDEDDRDGKDRLLRYVWVPREDAEGYLLNTKLVREGYAGFDPRDDNDKYDERLDTAEEDAREQERGVWGACGELHADEPDAGRCLDVDQAMTDAIATGLEGGLSLRGAQAVRSEDFEEVYFIAADIEEPGMDGADQIGVWASNALKAGEGLILAVNEVAQELTDWPDADSTDAEMTMADDGAEEARGCVDDAL
jgi:endonuclease YncB( thermonuclease family)